MNGRILLDRCYHYGLIVLISLSGCTTAPIGKPGQPYPSTVNLEPVKAPEPVSLRIKSQVGRSEQVAYLHKSLSRSYNGTEIHKSLEEIVEFTAKSDTTKVGSSGEVTQVISVMRKDGTANLHHFAMPELNEKLEVTTSPLGRVLKSGNYPKTSLFFVPTISLPERSVKIGDTWSMNANWISMDEGIPFSLEMVSILKGVYVCGKSSCADIEVSGDVYLDQNILKQVEKPAQFKSEWRGRILFDINSGSVVWSKVNSDERFVADPVNRHVRSCLESVLLEPAQEKLSPLEKPTCEDFGAKAGAALQ